MPSEKVITEKMFLTALKICCDNEIEYYRGMNGKEPHTFTPGFMNRMNKLCGKRRRLAAVRVCRRVAIAFTLCITLFFTAIMSVSAWRKEFFQIVEKAYEDFIQIVFEKTEDTPPSPERFIEYELGDVPDGFMAEKSEINLRAGMKLEEYRNGEEYILFRQAGALDQLLYIDAGNMENEIVSENGVDYHIYSNKSANNVLWNKGQYYFLITGNIDKETLLELAISMKIKLS